MSYNYKYSQEKEIFEKPHYVKKIILEGNLILSLRDRVFMCIIRCCYSDVEKTGSSLACIPYYFLLYIPITISNDAQVFSVSKSNSELNNPDLSV